MTTVLNLIKSYCAAPSLVCQFPASLLESKRWRISTIPLWSIVVGEKICQRLYYEMGYPYTRLQLIYDRIVDAEALNFSIEVQAVKNKDNSSVIDNYWQENLSTSTSCHIWDGLSIQDFISLWWNSGLWGIYEIGYP